MRSVPSGWVEIKSWTPTEIEKISHCKLEGICSSRQLKPLDLPDIAPLLTANFDIECVDPQLGFPDAEKDDNVICQIGMVLHRVGTPKESAVRVLFVDNQRCADVEGTFVFRYENEAEMLRGFRNEFIRFDPDVLVHFNGFSFDLPYIARRAEKLHRGPLLLDDSCRKCKLKVELRPARGFERDVPL